MNIGSNNYLNFILRNNYNNGFLNYLIYISQFKKFKYDLVLKKLIISNLRGILYALKNIQYENTYVEFRIMIKILAYFPIFKNVKLYFILFCKSLFHLFFKILRLFNRNKYS